MKSGKMQTKPKSVRKPLRDVSNEIGTAKFSKPIDTACKSVVLDKMEKQRKSQHDDCLDNLLLVHSDLNSITCGIDEIVAEAFKLNPISKEAKCEIESFTCFLSDTIEALKPWIPRFRKLLTEGSIVGGENVCDLNNEGDIQVDSPEGEKLESLISPSPLVQWRGGCDVERGGGRQLFLLTPLPMSKTLSFKRQELAKSVFERVDSVQFPSMLMVSEDVDGDSHEGVAVKESPAVFLQGDKSLLVMTPSLKMSPPKSCALLEPISESSHKVNEKMRKSTPYPVGIHSSFSDSSGSDSSEDLSLRLLGIQHGYKSGFEKKRMDESPQWSFSPPKTCVLLNPSDDKSENAAATDHDLPVFAPITKENVPSDEKSENVAATDHDLPVFAPVTKENVGRNFQLVKSSCRETVTGRSKPVVESTPVGKEPESTLRTGKLPGETTLKRELWTKFEAASSYGFRVNASAFQRTAERGFLDMLDEASCEGEGAVAADGFR